MEEGPRKHAEQRPSTCASFLMPLLADPFRLFLLYSESPYWPISLVDPELLWKVEAIGL